MFQIMILIVGSLFFTANSAIIFKKLEIAADGSTVDEQNKANNRGCKTWQNSNKCKECIDRYYLNRQNNCI